ncbi:hypothetical protein [Mucilaginibacter dorajii]|uniref:Novel STAND NTPase 1 domain-containing protein n=1 Tax=Mucilaginibacter dorajii TaxID=692994 RepID=A0ABP7QYR3_9SPHI|nr:hypothetical protein [Mucilaginibacter dorajii]MCS3732357.1 hypothetical protein [Mucilaginibacter dorajii]
MIKEENPPVLTKDRYPGLRSFEEGDAQVFFGRENELQQLASQLGNNRVNIIFGSSGVGKSSLLNVAFNKGDKLSAYLPVKIRITQSQLDENLNTEVSPLLQIVRNRIFEKLDIREEPELLFDSVAPKLWEYVKYAETTLREQPSPQTLTLIFDQFEEFFFNFDPYREDFCQQLAEICHEAPPIRILNWINQLDDNARSDEIMNWYKQPKVRVIFSIRSDKLALLNDLVSYIPKLLQNRLELKLFNRGNARLAIERPAELDNKNLFFSTPPIAIEPAVVTKMLDELSNPLGQIEGSFLQIVCFYIEVRIKAIVKKQKLNIIDPVAFKIEDYKEISIATILDKFYDDQMKKITDVASRELAKKVIEEHLVSDGVRASFLPNQLKRRLKNDDELISLLLKYRIIRIEETPRGPTYELSHDKLIIPVEKSRKLRQQREFIEKEAQKQRAALVEEARKQAEKIAQQKRELERESALRKEAQREREKAELANRHADINREIAVKAQKKAEFWKRGYLTFLVLCGVLALFFYYLYFTTSTAKNNNLYYQADLAYNQNNHFLAFHLWNTYQNKVFFAGKKDSIKAILQSKMFFDIAGGDNIKQLNHNRFVVHYKDNAIAIWWADDNYQRLNYLPLLDNNRHELKSAINMLVSDNRRYIAYRSTSDSKIHVYDDQAGKPLMIEESRLNITSGRKPFRDANIDDYKMEFLKNNNFIAFIATSGNIVLYNLATRQQVKLPLSNHRLHYQNGDIRNMFLISTNQRYMMVRIPGADSLSIWDIGDHERSRHVLTFNHIDQVFSSSNGDSLICKAKNNDLFIAPFSERAIAGSRLIKSGVNDLLLSPDRSKALLLVNNSSLVVYDFIKRSVNARVNGDAILKKLTAHYKSKTPPARQKKKNKQRFILGNNIPKFASIVRWNLAGDRFSFRNDKGIVYQIAVADQGQSYFLFTYSRNLNSFFTTDGHDYVLSPDGRKCAYINTSGKLVVVDVDHNRIFAQPAPQLITNLNSNYASIYNLDDLIRFSEDGNSLAYVDNLDTNNTAVIIYDFITNRVSYRFDFAKSIGKVFNRHYIQLVTGVDNVGGIYLLNQKKRDIPYFEHLYPDLSKEAAASYATDPFSNH